VTQSPDAPPLAFVNLADAIGALRNAGLRISTPRRLVLEALFAATGPVSAADLARELSLDESSVYRNLEVLEQLGVVRHVHLGHSPGLYTLVSDEVVEYLCCERCGKVTAVPPARLDAVREQIHDEFGYTARFTHFAIVGLCPDCASAAQAHGARTPPSHTPTSTCTRGPRIPTLVE
jgi:Fur family ferric uptake transcriptional regulator